ncbi:MAG: UPF0158 family protein [Anaerolineae bacterium]
MIQILATDILRAVQNKDETITWYVDRQTGAFHPFSTEEKGLGETSDFLDVFREDPDRFLAVEEIPRKARYKFLIDFIDMVEDGRMRVEVAQAAAAKMPFKAFNSMMKFNPDLNKLWTRHEAMRQLKYLMAWFQYKGIDATLKMPGA